MHAALVCFAALIVAAPAAAPDLKAKEKLEALKTRLPGIVTEWIKGDYFSTWLPDNQANKLTCKPQLRVLRRVGPERAKAVINPLLTWKTKRLSTLFLRSGVIAIPSTGQWQRRRPR
jgi:hypothetical protein